MPRLSVGPRTLGLRHRAFVRPQRRQPVPRVPLFPPRAPRPHPRGLGLGRTRRPPVRPRALARGPSRIPAPPQARRARSPHPHRALRSDPRGFALPRGPRRKVRERPEISLPAPQPPPPPARPGSAPPPRPRRTGFLRPPRRRIRPVPPRRHRRPRRPARASSGRATFAGPHEAGLDPFFPPLKRGDKGGSHFAFLHQYQYMFDILIP